MRSFAICDTLSFAIVCHLIDTMLNLKHYLKQLKAKTFFFFLPKVTFQMFRLLLRPSSGAKRNQMEIVENSHVKGIV